VLFGYSSGDWMGFYSLLFDFVRTWNVLDCGTNLARTVLGFWEVSQVVNSQ